MQPNLEFRNLDISWADAETLLKLESSSDALDAVESCGVYRVETTTFRRYQPWLGLRINEPLVHPPYCMLGSGGQIPLLPVKDPATRQIWWIHSTGWDEKNTRHLSEMYRTAGTVELVVQNRRYDLVVHTANFSVDELEYYLRDFKNELWMLILNEQSAIKGRTEQEVPNLYSDELVDRLKDFVEALEHIAKTPGVELKEIQALMPARSVRPINRTFMELATKGQSRFLTGRTFQESLNTPDNQHLHYCLSRVNYLVSRFREISSARIRAFEVAMASDLSRLQELAQTEFRVVNQTVFDNEIREIERELRRNENVFQDALSGQKECSVAGLRKGGCNIVLGKLFRNAETEFFCNQVNGRDYKKEISDGKYLTVKLPGSFASFAQKFQQSKFEFRVEGFYRKLSYERADQLEFFYVNSVAISKSPLQQILDRQLEQRYELARNEWKIPLVSAERSEVKKELKTLQARAWLYEEQVTSLNDFIIKVLPLEKRLAELRGFFRKQCVGQRHSFPNSMAFVQNPDYAMSRASYRKIMAMPGMDASLFESMTVIEQIGLVNVASLYEKWCLLKILKVLTEIYGFTIRDDDWKRRLVQAVKCNQFDISFDLHCVKRKQQIRLTYEKQLASGKRPDFVLDFCVYDLLSNMDSPPAVPALSTRLIMDAKFRDGLNDDSLAELAQDMYLGKNYSEDGSNQVFILHPSRQAISRCTSPLEWGRDCDYGQIVDHRYGGIYLAPSLKGKSSLDNLQRLIGMVLQSLATHRGGGRTEEKLVHSFTCIGCGNHDQSRLVVDISTTGGGNNRVVIECSACSLISIRTVCVHCSADLYKNGYYWTYHRTRAAQISNVVCPSCNSFL